jgi:hypothetical protein
MMATISVRAWASEGGRSTSRHGDDKVPLASLSARPMRRAP